VWLCLSCLPHVDNRSPQKVKSEAGVIFGTKTLFDKGEMDVSSALYSRHILVHFAVFEVILGA
jgi:hypothetical protein